MSYPSQEALMTEKVLLLDDEKDFLSIMSERWSGEWTYLPPASKLFKTHNSQCYTISGGTYDRKSIAG